MVRHIVDRIAAASEEDARARYDFGRILHHLRYGDAGSTSFPVRELAIRLGVDSSALHRCARVSEAILPAEFDWLVRLRTERGMPLTWSHIERLACERNATRRRRLAETAVRDQSSVRALSARVRNEPRRAPVKETVSKSTG